MGSYLAIIRADGRAEVRYPIFINRQGHWRGVRPGDTEPTAILLPPAEDIAENEVYIPAGEAWIGEVERRHSPSNGLPYRQLWFDAYIIQKFPVTNLEYIEFLNSLVDAGADDEAIRHAPQERAGTIGEQGAIIYGRDNMGHFFLRPDVDGDVWQPEWPVIMIDAFSAKSYAEWYADTTGTPWRLPNELEWEKAARGVDGRLFPWGWHGDSNWACNRDNRIDGAVLENIGAFEHDISPFGVRDMGGNVADWVAGRFQKNGPPTSSGIVMPVEPIEDNSGVDVARRGGHWAANANHSAVNRAMANFGTVHPTTGIRLVRSYP